MQPARQGEFFPQPNAGGGVKGEKGRQQKGERHRIKIGQAGHIMQGGVYPVKLGGVGRQPEQIGRRHGAARAQFPKPDQRGKQERHQPEMVIRGEGERRGGGEKQQQRPVEKRLLPIGVEFVQEAHRGFNRNMAVYGGGKRPSESLAAWRRSFQTALIIPD